MRSIKNIKNIKNSQANEIVKRAEDFFGDFYRRTDPAHDIDHIHEVCDMALDINRVLNLKIPMKF